MDREAPSWIDIPQMMRITITTYNVLEMLDNWEIARPYNFLLIPMVDRTFGYAFHRRAGEKVLLVAPFSSKQEQWFKVKCVNIHSGKKYRMMDCKKTKLPPCDALFPSQFARLLIEYQEQPEAKSLAPNGQPCVSNTKGLLRRAHITAGDFRYVGKESDRKWEEAEEIRLLEFKSAEYGRSKMVVASAYVRSEIEKLGINKCARESGFDRKNFIRKLVRGIAVKRTSYLDFVQWLASHKSVT